MAYLFALTGGSVQETVLCLGQDGHVAVEAAQNGNCEGFLVSFQLADSSSSKEPASTLNRQQCNPCVDVALSTMLSHQTSPSNQDNLALQHGNPPDDFGSSENPSRVLSYLSAFNHSLGQTSLRTTVLLI